MSFKLLMTCALSTAITLHCLWISDVDGVKELKTAGEKRTRSHNLQTNHNFFQPSLNIPYLNHKQLRGLGNIVHERLNYLQNPDSCRSRRKLHCKLHLCGFGCTINTIVTCLMIAYATNRTTVVSPALTSVLKPLSLTCMTVDTGNRSIYGKELYAWSLWRDGLQFLAGKTTAVTLAVETLFSSGYQLPDQRHENVQVVEYYLVRNKYEPEFHPPAVPDDLFETIKRYHDNPFLWWVGQFSNYVVRPRDATMDQLLSMGTISEFKRPIVGVHIRRTDKPNDLRGRYHAVSKYMDHVEEWFKRRPNSTRRIYLATDEPEVVLDIKEKYPQYIVINDFNITSNAGVIPEDRMSEKAQFEIFHDVYFLSKCDFIVCTFSSNVCRLVFQLMNAEQGNVSRRTVMSLDRDWHFKRASKERPRQGYGTKMPHYKIPLESKSLFNNKPQ